MLLRRELERRWGTAAPEITDDRLRAPGMLALHLSIDTVEEPVRVRVWDDEVPAFDMGDVAAQWFTDFLGRKLRLVRFDPDHRRLSSAEWTGGTEALNQFSDGYPLLVLSAASIDLLNEKLAAQGHAPVGIERFRPNIVLDGIEAHDEDRLATLAIAAAEGEVRLRPVKPCARCPIPNVDPATAEVDPAVSDALQLGNDLAALLPAPQAQGMRKALRELGVPVIVIRPVPHLMLYDKTELYVEAGKPVEIVFDNVDIMPHNLLVVRPGSLEKVGLEAEKMATSPDAFNRGFRPDLPEVLHATPLLQPRQTARLNFTAPAEPDDYQYVCTFPGHWRRMFGTLHVVQSLDDVPPEKLLASASPVAATGEVRPFVRAWTLSDLEGDLPHLEHGRNREQGKDLFTSLACAKCHKMNGVGGDVGPDLIGVNKKLIEGKMTPLAVLTEEVSLRDVRVPASAILGEEGRGLALAQTFVHENRIRQAASSLGAAQYCVDESVRYARERVVFGQPLWHNQAIQFPLAELHTECALVRALVQRTAWELDQRHHMDVTDRVSMCNVRANRLVCDAADRAIQVHGGIGYTRHKPFEHIYRHHRRYRITEGSDEIQLRRVAGILFGRAAKR